jgi:hypothetical protein
MAWVYLTLTVEEAELERTLTEYGAHNWEAWQLDLCGNVYKLRLKRKFSQQVAGVTFHE